MPITIRPSMSPDRELDLTQALTAAVAHELWKHCGGNEIVNWLEAERIVGSLMARGQGRTSPGILGGGRHAGERGGRRRRQESDRVTGPIAYL